MQRIRLDQNALKIQLAKQMAQYGPLMVVVHADVDASFPASVGREAAGRRERGLGCGSPASHG
jgi:hypothetical protein